MLSTSFKYPVIILILLVVFSCKTIEPVYLGLNNDWKFKGEKDTIWLKAEVPGTVHTDLLNNNLIEDPFYRLNEKDLQWIDKQGWVYKRSFEINASIFKKERLEIHFKGLDTYAQIFLNDVLISSTDNMFVGCNVNVKPYVILGINHLKIVFKSPIEVGLEKRESLGYRLPNAVNDQSENGGLGKKQVSIFSRKPGYHFGWDWGPRLVTSGIWRDINLVGWNKVFIRDVYIKQEVLNTNQAKLSSELEVEATQEMDVTVKIKVDSETTITKKQHLISGVNKIKIPFIINEPELWWTNGLGNQKLYNVTLEVFQKGKVLASNNKLVGLKTLKVVQEKDEVGESFYFELNGRPVFMKGANYIPQDVFLSRVVVEDYEETILNMVDANYNMIRVWGGGIYEKEIFYNLCDKYGILVWQDFMFACAMYPGNKAFLESVKKEAIYNVKRLRNHTCIALWCGNNENLTAWKNWGWIPEVLNSQGQAAVDKVWKGYTDVFHEILPEVVTEFDNDTFYWASSPTSAPGVDATLTSGDYHYWRVWGQQAPFSTFNEYIPRFMSEYGFQSFPEFTSVQKFTRNEDWDIYSEVMKSHQRHPIGNKNIEYYMKPIYNQPKDFQSFLYVSQLLQARGMQMAIEAHRRNMPYCMGSLYWQINDCWPVASWSTIDYYGNWKAGHYKVKDLYKSIKAMFYESNDQLEIHIVSDAITEKKAKLKFSIVNFSGKLLKSEIKTINIKANTSAVYYQKSLENMLLNENKSNIFAMVELLNNNNEVFDESIHYFQKPNKLNLTKPSIEYSITTFKNNQIVIDLKSNVLAKDVRLSSIVKGRFSNNYFDLVPNKNYRIKFLGEEEIDIDLFKKELKIISLIDSY